VTVFEMAATDRAQTLKLYRSPRNSGGSTLFGSKQGLAEVSVEGRTIDSLNLPPIDVCKMDVEGAEPIALNGMRDTIARSPKLKLLIEWNSDSQSHFLEAGGDSQNLLSLIRSYFSSIEVIEGSKLSAEEAPPAFCNLWAQR
jgi:hypothetical protein